MGRSGGGKGTSINIICKGLIKASLSFCKSNFVSPVLCCVTFPIFFRCKYWIRGLNVSFMNRDIIAIGAAMIRITHCDQRQLLEYSWIIYAPVRGPRVGPRKGLNMKNTEARPRTWFSNKSTMEPGVVSIVKW